jgi:hypothetical protein
LDIGAVLTESAVMNSDAPRNDALDLLRAIFDLADADIQPDPRLLARLTGHDPGHVADLLVWLRLRGLLQLDQLGLTMAGLMVAAGLPEFELAPMAEPPRSPAQARRAA